ncbi:hypothetical protein ACFB49_42820 [Sphingomonas sp. DBB INV C78]
MTASERITPFSPEQLHQLAEQLAAALVPTIERMLGDMIKPKDED